MSDSSTPDPTGAPVPPPAATDGELTLSAACAVLDCGIRASNPWTRATLLETAAQLMREHAVVVSAPQPAKSSSLTLDED